MTLFERLRFRLRMLRLGATLAPIAGGAPEEDPDSDPDPDPAPADPTPDPDPDPAPDPDPDPSDPADPDPDPNPEDKSISVKEKEWNALRRELAEARKDRKREAARRKKADEDRAKEEGKHKELAERYEAERDDALRQLEQQERRASVSAVAGRLKFRDPQDAHRFLNDSDMEDEASVEDALARIATEKPYLIDRGRQRQTASVNPGGGTPTEKTRLTTREASAEAAKSPEAAKKLRADIASGAVEIIPNNSPD